MMDYKELLERAEKQIPEEVKTDVRFKLPPPAIKIQGNRTFFQNFKELADKCDRDPGHLLKYLSRELATFGIVKGQQAIFTGKFSSELIKRKFTAYIKEFVICRECGKPDTKLIKEQRMLFMKCTACGARHVVRNL